MSAIIAAGQRPKLAVIAMQLEEGAGALEESGEADDETLATGGSGWSTSLISSGGLVGFAGACVCVCAVEVTCVSSTPGSAGMTAISPLRSTHGCPASPKQSCSTCYIACL